MGIFSNVIRLRKSMKLVQISLFGTLAAQEILGPRGQPLAFGKQPEFDENDEVYRIHFYPKTGSEKDEYVLFKRVTSESIKQVNVQEIPDALYYMTSVAKELKEPKRFDVVAAQRKFVKGFTLDFSQVWQYGCFGQMRPAKHGRGDPIDKIDELYQRHQICQACVQNDYEIQKKSKLDYSFCYDLKQQKFLCPKDPKRNTATQWAQCECDARLANDLAESTKKGAQFRKEVSFEIDCPEKERSLSLAQSSQCCGEYPNRFMFHSDGRRECCASKLFNSGSSKCCNRSIISIDEECEI